jgi:tRNA A-37 threonylcarbamoyl transferase component Bud32
LAGAKTAITWIGSVRWKTSPEFLPVLESVFPHGGDPDRIPRDATVLKEGLSRIVYHFQPPSFDGRVLVKRYRPGSLVDRLRDLVTPSIGEREWNAARRLGNLGVRVPETLAVGVPHSFGVPFGSLFLSRFLDAVSVYDLLTSGRGEPPLWEALGRFLAGIHRSDFFHPDLHLGNILAFRSDGEWRFAQVDLHAISPLTALTPSRMERNLAQVRNAFIAGESRDFLRGLRAYLRDGAPPGLDPSGLARRVRDLADRLLENHYRRRTARCLTRSTAFAVERIGRYRVYRRRSIPASQVLAAVEAARRGGEGTVLKDGGNTQLTADLPFGDGRVIVKAYTPQGPGAWLQAILGTGRGRAAWLGGNGLAARKVGVALPLALVEERTAWIPHRAWVLLEDLRSLPQLDGLLARATQAGLGRAEREGASALGAFLGELHRKGIYHADLKACNILVEGWGEDRVRFLLLDHDRLVFGETVPDRRRLKNLVQMNTSVPKGLPGVLRARFLKAYIACAPYPGGFNSLWRDVAEESRGREIVYVGDEGDVIEKGF